MIGVGQRLREERLKRKLTLEEVSKNIKIRINFLSAIEKGEYQKLPSHAYAYGFVKNYAEFLGLPKQEILALFRREFNEDKVYKVLPEGFVKSSNFLTNRKKIQENLVFIAIVFLFFLGYIFFQYRYAFINPPLEIYTPKKEEIFSSREIIVSGKTDANANLYINNNSVSIDKDGHFEKNLDLFHGKATIKIKVINRFGKETEIERDIEIKSR